jgi:mono/diheme cytochrome c family protein
MKELSKPALCWAIALAFTAATGCKRSQAKHDAQAEAQRTFAMVCARCHGPDGSGASLTPSLATARNFRDAAFHEERSDEDLARVIRDGKGAMPPFANVYPPEQIAALVQVIRGFNPEKKR